MGYSCSQSILAAFSEDLGLAKETAFRVACGLGAGCARTGQLCGAVTGAYLAIGLKHGKVLPEDDIAREKTYSLISEFNLKFLGEYHSLNCTELTGYNLGKEGEYQKAADEKVFENICRGILEKSASILEEIL